MGTFLIFIPILLYIGIPAVFLYVVYRVVNGWVERTTAIRREQNQLLAKLIETVDRKSNGSESNENDIL
ncbi:MAG: hypothetical protein EAS52_14665 [Parapedobacter sp.]|nr:MAG: hypothetical protein EAS52_14665 [Parapedobacter sp.]